MEKTFNRKLNGNETLELERTNPSISNDIPFFGFLESLNFQNNEKI
jgi:hypothetical protein